MVRGFTLRSGSVHKIDHDPVPSVQKPGELSEVWGRNVFIDSMKIAMVCYVQRVEPEPHMMCLAMAGTEERNAKFAIELHV
jgi:hypothetical protein